MADNYIYKTNFDPIALVGETLHLSKSDEELDVEIMSVGAMPHYIKDFGSVTAETWLRSQQDTNLEMPLSELAQWRIRVLDDIRIYLKNPPSAEQWRTANVNFWLPKFPDESSDWLKEYYFKASEFFTYKTDIPSFDIYPEQTLTKSRVLFSGYRFRVKKIATRGKVTLFVNGWGR